MNSKGSALGGVALALMIIVVLFFMVAVLGNFWDTAAGDCDLDENGTPHNCSLSTGQYDALSQTDSYTATTITAGSTAPVFLVGITFVVVFLAFVAKN